MNGFQVIVEIEAEDKLHVLKCQDRGRGEKCVEILCDLTLNWPELFVGRTAAVSYGDHPPDPGWVKQFDFSFCTTKRVGQKSPCLPFPCPYSLRWPEVGIPDAEQMLESMLVDDTPAVDHRIFWIGADTHVSRRELWKLGQRYPEWFDVEMMEWDRKAPGGQRSKTRQVSLPDHRKFKYLIDCPGYGYSARLKWLLAAGRPVFVVDRPSAEQWHDEMVPWVHYVPVAADLSDLMEHHQRLETDPTLYERISTNARAFAAKYLRVEDQICRTAEAVKQKQLPQPARPRQTSIAPGKKAAMVVARYGEDLAWIDAVPGWIQVFIINKGEPLPDHLFRKQDPIIERRENLGREADSYLAFMESGRHRGYDWVIFTQGDPFSHSSDFLSLLDHADLWNDIQPLTRRWVHLPPAALVEYDRENGIRDLQVRKELISLHTLDTVRYHDPGSKTIFNRYCAIHRQANGANLAEHFFTTIFLDRHAELARQADLGNFCFGAIFAVRGHLVGEIPLKSIQTARRLCQTENIHAYILERLWLHFFGEPFLHLKSPDASTAASLLASDHATLGGVWNGRKTILRELVSMLGAGSYLELGLGNGDIFVSIECTEKAAVNPEPIPMPAAGVAATAAKDGEKMDPPLLHPTHRTTVENFLESNEAKFDVIFLQGNHSGARLERNLKNSLKSLNPGGAVVCTNLIPPGPPRSPEQAGQAVDDGWKAWVKLRSERPDLCMFVVDIESGVGVILADSARGPQLQAPAENEMDWLHFIKHRRTWLHLLSPLGAKKFALEAVKERSDAGKEAVLQVAT